MKLQQRYVNEDINALKRPQMFWFNLILTLILLVGLVVEIMPLAVLFMIGSSIALVMNYPNVKDQQARITAQGENILPVIAMIFAAGTLTGIMSGTKMLDQMAQFLVAIIPAELGPHLGLVMAGASLPLTYFLTNDAVYFGIMPVIVKTAAAYGISSAEIARALLVGQCAHLLSPMVASTYLLVNLTGVNYGEFQKFALLWANGSSIIMLIIVLIMGLVPL
jgi:CitMHS family citrate-Mg2+:H+ or citrate-Ca2+:H+ symporter